MTDDDREDEREARRGRWVRGFGYKYWEGPCTCGSGKEGWEVYDDHGIYFGIACNACRREPTPGWTHEEPIDDEEGSPRTADWPEDY